MNKLWVVFANDKFSDECKITELGITKEDENCFFVNDFVRNKFSSTSNFILKSRIGERIEWEYNGQHCYQVITDSLDNARNELYRLLKIILEKKNTELEVAKWQVELYTKKLLEFV